MANFPYKIAQILGSALLLTACIQEEPLNAEADILVCRLSSDKDILMVEADTLINIPSTTESIEIPILTGADLHSRAPRFDITEGATIEPASGSVHDFSGGKSVRYTVTSEDGKWKRSYNVSYLAVELTTRFDFEEYVLTSNDKYHQIIERVNGRPVMNWWGTGNPGYQLANSKATPTEYPSAIIPNGKSGNCLQLTTQYAGVFGKMSGMPIAPGNLFIGSFDLSKALKAPLTATRFGVPFRQIPQKIKGYYKFKSGEQMTDENYNPIAGKDSFNIYALFYENTNENGEEVIIDGTNSNNDRHIVLYGKIKEQKETDDWTSFSVEMEPMNNKKIDSKRLANYGYNFAIVFSSSLKGDIFTGAVGSTLLIDEVEVECEGN